MTTDQTDDLPARLEAVLTERYTELGNPFSEMRRREQAADGWPASHPVGPRHVAEVLRELLAAVPVPPPAGIDRRAQLLDALDFAYCQGLGFDTPEALLAAYDVSRGVPVPPPANQTALRQRIAEVLWPLTDWDGDQLNAEAAADAVLAVLPEQTDRNALTLTAVERQFLAFALDLAADEMASRGNEFTAEDEAALEKLRRVAAEEQPVERPRCPHCQLPHDLTPGSLPAAVCASTRQRIAVATQAHTVGDHSGCCRVDCDALQAVGEQPETQEADRA